MKRVVHYPDIFDSIAVSSVFTDRSEVFATFNENGAASTLLITVASDGSTGGDGTSGINLSVFAVANDSVSQHPLEDNSNRSSLFVVNATSSGDPTYPIVALANAAATHWTMIVNEGKHYNGPIAAYFYVLLKAVGTAYTADPDKKLVIDVHGFG